jgi:transposase-like protein
MVKPNHREIKRPTNPGMKFGSFKMARRTFKGYEMMKMIRKGQVKEVVRAVHHCVQCMHQIFGVVA